MSRITVIFYEIKQDNDVISGPADDTYVTFDAPKARIFCTCTRSFEYTASKTPWGPLLHPRYRLRTRIAINSLQHRRYGQAPSAVAWACTSGNKCQVSIRGTDCHLLAPVPLHHTKPRTCGFVSPYHHVVNRRTGQQKRRNYREGTRLKLPPGHETPGGKARRNGGSL